MKTKFILLASAAFALLPLSGTCQQLPDTTSLSFDMLQVPNTPALALMDLAPSSIDEPKVPADFAVSLRQSTDSFSTWPKSYAIEFAPAWVFGRDKIDFSKFTSNKLGSNIWQSLTFSAGINHLDDPNLPADNGRTTQLGVGFKISILRGRIESSRKDLDNLYTQIGRLNEIQRRETENQLNANARYKFWKDSIDWLRSQPEIEGVKLKVAVDSINQVLNKLNQANNAVSTVQDSLSESSRQYDALKPLLTGLKMNRRGFKLDLASGFVTDFYDRSIDSSQITRAGAWLTGGWVFKPTENQLNTSILGVLRVLGNPNQLYRPENDTLLLTDDNLFFDYGARLILHNGKRFSLSAEVLRRVPINNDGLKPTSRYVLNMDYQVTKAIVLSFNIGKNFDGTVNKSGNLITALQMFTSLGRRSYNNGKIL